MRKILRKIYAFLFGETTIAVGHGLAGRSGKNNAVMLFVGRKVVALTPEGARKIADQLHIWADHAETYGSAIRTMRFIVKVAKGSAVQAAAEEWVHVASKELTSEASTVIPDRSQADASEVAR